MSTVDLPNKFGVCEIDAHSLDLSISIDNLEKDNEIYKAKWNDMDVSVKKFTVSDEEEFKRFENEVSVLRYYEFVFLNDILNTFPSSIDHPNISKIYGICTSNKNEYYMVFEELNENLNDILFKNFVKLPMVKRLKYALDIANALVHLNNITPSVIHRDLKLSNFLVDVKGVAKLTNFSISQTQNGSRKDNGKTPGTLLFMAPEIFSNQEFNEKIDVYSFGIVLWQLIERKTAFTDLTQSISKKVKANLNTHTPEDWKKAVLLTFRKAIIDGIRPKFSSKFYENPKYSRIVSLITMCWHPIPDKRPTFEYIQSELFASMLHLSIPIEMLRNFWSTKIGVYELDLEPFIEEFLQFLCIDPNNILYHLSKSMLKNFFRSKTITMKTFGHFVQCHWKNDCDAETVMNAAIALETAPYFHGYITANKVLSKFKAVHQNQLFLIRYSNTKPGTFSFSVSYNGKLYHYHTQRLAECGNFICIVDDKVYENENILYLINETVQSTFKDRLQYIPNNDGILSMELPETILTCQWNFDYQNSIYNCI